MILPVTALRLIPLTCSAGSGPTIGGKHWGKLISYILIFVPGRYSAFNGPQLEYYKPTIYCVECNQCVTLLRMSLYKKEQAPSRHMMIQQQKYTVSVCADRMKYTGHPTQAIFDTSSHNTLYPSEQFGRILQCIILDGSNERTRLHYKQSVRVGPFLIHPATTHCICLSRSGKLYSVPLSTLRMKGPDFSITDCPSRAIFDILQNIHYRLSPQSTPIQCPLISSISSN